MKNVFKLAIGIVLLTLVFASVGWSQSIADIVLIIDSSSSMGSNDPSNLRKSAAKLFVALAASDAESGVQIAVVDFDDWAVTRAPLTVANATGKDQLEAAVDQINSSGGTDIADGLRQGFDVLSAADNLHVRKAAVLLTDGRDSSWTQDIVLAYKEQDWSIYTIGLGEGVDAIKLKDIAAATPEGEYYPVDLSKIQEIYNKILAKITRKSVLSSLRGFLNQDQQVTKNVLIDTSIGQADFSASWTGSTIEMVLVDPNGAEITPDLAPVLGIGYQVAPTFVIYTVDNPMEGEWKMQMKGTDIPPEGEPYSLVVTGTSDFVTNLLAFEAGYAVGDPIRVGLRIQEKTGDTAHPVLDATATADVFRPDGRIETLNLFDDGTHNDSAAGDGVYASNYTNVDILGTYLIRASAQNGFYREIEQQIVVGAIDNVFIDGSTLVPAAGATLNQAPNLISAVISGPAGSINSESIVLQNDSGSGLNFRIHHDVIPQTYYVRVTASGKNSTGNYTIHASFTPKTGVEPNPLGLTFPDKLISDVALTPNYTYFVLNPQFAVSEKDEAYFHCKCTITLRIVDKQNISDESIKEPNGLPKEYPYFMIPIDETPREKAAAANDIEDGIIEKAFGNAASELIEGGALEVAGRLPIIGAFVGPISLAKDVILTFIGSKGSSDAIVAAMREELREALMDPKVTIWNYSSFFRRDWKDAFKGNPHPILFIIPKRLTSIKVEMEQDLYAKDLRIPIMIKGEKKERGTFPLFGSDQWKWTLTISPNPSETINGSIRLPSRTYADVKTPVLLNFLNLVDEYIGHYKSDRLREGTELYNQLRNQGNLVLEYYIPESFKLLREAIESTPELQDLSIGGDLRNLVYPTGVIGDANVIASTIYTGWPRTEKYYNTWNLENTFRQEQENRASAAPRAQPTSLADYPPFQRLSPEVQEYLLQYFEGTTTSKAINSEAWQTPEQTSLLPNYPNPFNPETWIPYQLSEPADVTLTIYDINGRVVRNLELGHHRAGIYQSKSRAAYWDGRNTQGEPVASGVYFYTLSTESTRDSVTAGDFTATRKMLIRK